MRLTPTVIWTYLWLALPGARGTANPKVGTTGKIRYFIKFINFV